MTLKEKFEEVEIIFESQLLKLKQDEFCETADDCEQIADNYAIEFATWISQQPKVNIIKKSCIDNSYMKMSSKELLEIFKKEQKWK